MQPDGSPAMVHSLWWGKGVTTNVFPLHFIVIYNIGHEKGYWLNRTEGPWLSLVTAFRYTDILIELVKSHTIFKRKPSNL